jgi:phenylalanine ammonia-lyase
MKSTTKNNDNHEFILGEQPLDLTRIARVAYNKQLVKLTDNPDIKARVQLAYQSFQEAVQGGQLIYGVNTGFGGMADVRIDQDHSYDLQENLLWFMQTGTGKRIPSEYVRAALLIRCHSHLQGLSGVRWELLERMVFFLNHNISPQVYEHGSIGASGDLVPLTHITGALIGLDADIKVDVEGTEMNAVEVLKHFQLDPIRLQPKEGLAMVNGTSVTTAIAALNLHRAKHLVDCSLGFHELIFQGLHASVEPLEAFIHRHKQHPGQVQVAERLYDALQSSKLIRTGAYKQDELAQDRYSLRCAPQFIGPILDGLAHIEQQVLTEANAVTDNPLVDTETKRFYHGGNFLAQYMGIAMDQLRCYIGLMAKHMDAQIALVVHPAFNNGLSKSLIGNQERVVNMGLKGLQITGNAIMPFLTFMGNTFVDRFCTHAEQFNQNINSLGYGAALLAKTSLDTFEQYLSVALVFGVQAVDLRTQQLYGHYLGIETVSANSRPYYQWVYQALAKNSELDEPLIKDDNQQNLSHLLIKLQERFQNELLEPL